MRLRGTTDRPFPAADARLENPLINVSRLGIMEVEVGHGIAVVTAILKLVAGNALLCRAPTSTTDVPPPIGTARASNSDVTPAGEKFFDMLRQTSIQQKEGDTRSS